MATGIIKLKHLSNIADAIRSKVQNKNVLYPENMSDVIASIQVEELKAQEATSNARNIILKPDSEYNALNKVTASAYTKGLCSYSESSTCSYEGTTFGPIEPLILEGAYYISYDAGDKAYWGGRYFTRVFPSGTPLMIGAARTKDGYWTATIISYADLGELSSVISGIYLAKQTGHLSDGSIVYLYGGFNGGYRNRDIRIVHNNNDVLTITPSNVKVILPYTTANNNYTQDTILCNDEKLLAFVEQQIYSMRYVKQ